MSRTQPHLEERKAGLYWRRRVPRHARDRFIPDFFCFPLGTRSRAEAAGVAHRVTSISDICFNAEIDVPPEVMTRILVTFARLEIETADRLRALTGPRTREAAEAALSVEAALRASLRDAILRCERDDAYDAIASTAAFLGVTLDPDEEDYAILADKILRLKIDISEERERRARGQFRIPENYLDTALAEMSAPVQTGTPHPKAASGPAVTAPATQTLHSPSEKAPSPSNECPGSSAATPVFASRRGSALPPCPSSRAEPDEDISPAKGPTETLPADNACSAEVTVPTEESVHPKVTDTMPSADGTITEEASDGPRPGTTLFAQDGVEVRFATTPARPEAGATEPTILELFDEWFDFMSTGTITQGKVVIVDAGSADRFGKNADTTLATRKLIKELLPVQKMSQATDAVWQHWVNMLLRIPKNHGKSSKTRDLGVKAAILEADRADAETRKKLKRDTRKEDLTPKEFELRLKPLLQKRLSPRTVQRHQMTLSSALDHAVSRRRISANTSKDYVLKDKTVGIMKANDASTKRQLWGDEFQKLLATECWNSPDTRFDEALYWAPLIARLHGLRSEEILQLYVDDIRWKDGIAYFDIRQGTGQSLKSNNAPRMIPISEQLIELGFLHLVEKQKALKQKRLFPRAKRAKTNKLSYTANFTKKFTHYRKSRGVYEEGRDLHALRTSFHDDLITKGVPDTARRYLMGHNNPDVGIQHYLPEGFSLERLKEIIDAKKIDLSPITILFTPDEPQPEEFRPKLVAMNGTRVAATTKDKVA